MTRSGQLGWGLGVALLLVGVVSLDAGFGQDPSDLVAMPPPEAARPPADADPIQAVSIPREEHGRAVDPQEIEIDEQAGGSPAAEPTASSGLPGGLTEEHRKVLWRWQEQFAACDDPRQKDYEALHYATQSIHILMRYSGGADPGTAEEQERGFDASPRHENEWIFLSDAARFRFDRGEFPAYDQVRDRIRDARAVEGVSLERAEFPEELVIALNELAERALDCFPDQK